MFESIKDSSFYRSIIIISIVWVLLVSSAIATVRLSDNYLPVSKIFPDSDYKLSLN